MMLFVNAFDIGLALVIPQIIAIFCGRSRRIRKKFVCRLNRFRPQLLTYSIRSGSSGSIGSHTSGFIGYRIGTSH